MEAIVGKYKVRMESNHLVLTHVTGISFSLTLEEATGLFHFMSVYQEALTHKLADTEPRLESIRLEQPNEHSEARDLP